MTGNRLSWLRQVRSWRWSVAIVVAVMSTGRPGAGGEARTSGVVLLTFDTEQDPDAEAVASLAIDKPATYFFTGIYARRHEDLVRSLAAQGNSIGSHSFFPR
jgi:peptidoglycan/xylan/chitin deacetylase (PgdA/CDA1 family)